MGHAIRKTSILAAGEADSAIGQIPFARDLDAVEAVFVRAEEGLHQRVAGESGEVELACGFRQPTAAVEQNETDTLLASTNGVGRQCGGGNLERLIVGEREAEVIFVAGFKDEGIDVEVVGAVEVRLKKTCAEVELKVAVDEDARIVEESEEVDAVVGVRAWDLSYLRRDASAGNGGRCIGDVALAGYLKAAKAVFSRAGGTGGHEIAVVGEQLQEAVGEDEAGRGVQRAGKDEAEALLAAADGVGSQRGGVKTQGFAAGEIEGEVERVALLHGERRDGERVATDQAGGAQRFAQIEGDLGLDEVGVGGEREGEQRQYGSDCALMPAGRGASPRLGRSYHDEDFLL
ncbi:MAG: hypothetical protein IPJ98_18780 [Bryobacterales bacterium]|nr:hypothetical protein [Bryobacterales bacterium]